MRNKILTILISLAIFILTPHLSFAAIIEITLKPAIPGPNEEVRASLDGFTIDYDKATMVWYVDGEPQNTYENGVGHRSINFKTKDIGESTVIDLAIYVSSGSKLDKQLVVVPIEVDVLWEANTYTPPFYRGRALATNFSDITIMAIPHVAKNDTSSFVYTWTEDRFNVIKSASGYKKNSMVTTGAEVPLRKYVDVEINSLTTKAKAKSRATIPTVDPEAIFYISSPLTGVDYSSAIDSSYTLLDKEFLVRAEPFYLSQEAFADKLVKYEWYFDNSELVETNNDGLEFAFGRDVSSGHATIRFIATNQDDWFQIAQNSFLIEY